MESTEELITVLLKDWRSGNAAALNQLMPLVYDQLRALARNYMYAERPDHTLRPTAVVHEAYLRMARMQGSVVTDRAHFFAIAAHVMRHVLLDWARGLHRAKRGSGARKEQLDEFSAVSWDDPLTVIEIDRVLQRLAALDERKGKVVEMIFFGGMTYGETAEVLGLSAVTVHRELKMAKAWMTTEMRGERPAAPR